MTRASKPEASDMSEGRKGILIFAVILVVLTLFIILALRFLPFPGYVGYERALVITETLMRAVSSQHDLAPLILGSLAAVLGAGIIFGLELVSFSVRKHGKEISTSLRLKESILKLSKAADGMDSVIRDVVAEMKARENVLEELRNRIDVLSEEDEKLSQEVETLRQTPVPVAEYFQEINIRNLQQLEKKRARRDAIFFVLGIVVTTTIAVILKLFGP